MPLPKARKQIGRQGEAEAADFLKRQGYRILRRGFRTRFGEVDLIAREGPVLCFIEVKTRSQLEFGPPIEAVTSGKMKRMAKSAQVYLARHKLDEVPLRFDVVSVLETGGKVEFELFRGAFDSPLNF